MKKAKTSVRVYKRIRKSDLKELLAKFYSDFVELQPIDDIVEDKSSVNISINSICAYITDSSDFESEVDRNIALNEFAKEIEKISFGDLRVTYKGCRIDGNTCLTWAYVANAYEVIE